MIIIIIINILNFKIIIMITLVLILQEFITKSTWSTAPVALPQNHFLQRRRIGMAKVPNPPTFPVSEFPNIKKKYRSETPF